MGGECYDETHGHPHGNTSYHQFHHVQRFLGTIRHRHPDVHLVVITSVVPALPWEMKQLDADTHTGIISGERLGGVGWYDRNLLCLPTHKMHREGGIHWLIDQGSTEVKPCEEDQDQWYRMLEYPRARDAYIADRDRWMEWIDANRSCLRARRDLFACEEPGTGLQGTAHCVGDRGFIFLRNETDETITGEIPINHWLGLDLDGPGQFHIRQLHPQPTDLGVHARDERWSNLVPARTTLLLELRPATYSPALPPADLPEGTRVQKAFLTLEEVIARIEREDFWPAMYLPGRDNMPSF